MSKIEFKALPADMQERLFKIHSHAEVENDVNPNQAVYREVDVVTLVHELLQHQEKLATDLKLEMKAREEEGRCVSALQEFVQNEIVLIDAAKVIGWLGTVDKAIIWHAEQQKKKIEELKDEVFSQKELLKFAEKLLKFAEKVSVFNHNKWKETEKELADIKEDHDSLMEENKMLQNQIKNKIEVRFGTDLLKEVDDTLEKLKNQGLVLSVQKNNAADCVNYIIEFKNAEAAFLFGRSRPKLNL